MFEGAQKASGHGPGEQALSFTSDGIGIATGASLVDGGAAALWQNHCRYAWEH